MLISIIATLISSVALIGVALGLLLQARQLRASQIQIVRSLHVEFIKMGLDKPFLGAAIESEIDPDDLSNAAYLNSYLTFLQVGYSLKTIPKDLISYHAQRAFEMEFARVWWAWARKSYEIGAATKRDREFFVLVDSEFKNATRSNPDAKGHGGS